MLPEFRQSPTDPDFVQDPYPAYARARALGDVVWWDEYGMAAAVTHSAVSKLFRDKRFGREAPPERAPVVQEHLAPFYAIDAHSMLEAEPPRHTRLRGLVLRAFTSRQIADLAPEIDAVAADLIQDLPRGEPFDLLTHFAQPLPVRIIARLLGVPESNAANLLAWSNAMVKMYQVARTPEDEAAAVAATEAFVAWLDDVFADRRASPGDDLLSRLLAAEDNGARLSRAELTSTVILLLNAGHEATVHTLGNGVLTLLERGLGRTVLTPGDLATLVEEVLRFDPPLHIFTRWCYERCTMMGHEFNRGDQVALILGSANRDGAVYADPDRFDPVRTPVLHTSFGGGIHFCVGAPLARLELMRALPALFAACPKLRLAERSSYAPIYHFHGLESLIVEI